MQAGISNGLAPGSIQAPGFAASPLASPERRNAMCQDRGPPRLSLGAAPARSLDQGRTPNTRQDKARREGPIRAGGPSRLRQTKNQGFQWIVPGGTAGAPSPSREGTRSSIMAFTPPFKEKIVTFTSLYDNLAPLLAEMPHLATDHAALAALLTRARELEARQE